MVDVADLLYGLESPIYAELGVPATLDAGATGEVTITVIDATRRKSAIAGSVEVRSVGPSAFARIPELTAKGIARADYRDSTLSFNGRTWTVYSYELSGSPKGEDFGEVRFMLKDGQVIPPETEPETA